MGSRLFLLLHAGMAFGQLSYSGNVLILRKEILKGFSLKWMLSRNGFYEIPRGILIFKARVGDYLKITYRQDF